MENKHKIWLVASDVHIPEENSSVVDCWLQTVDLLKPAGIILNGDIMNCGTFSRHDIFSAPKCHWTDSEFLEASSPDFDRMNAFLDAIQKISPKSKKIFNMGNHEEWLNEFIKRSPRARNRLFSFEERLLLTDRSWKVVDYRKFSKIGKLRVTHTLFDSRSGGGGGKHHAAKHVETMGASILYGHYHDIQTASKVTPERNSHMAWCAGCLCDLNPGYLRNGPQNWSHGFAVVYLFPDNNFQVDIKRVVKGKVVVNGKLLDGAKHVFWK